MTQTGMKKLVRQIKTGTPVEFPFVKENLSNVKFGRADGSSKKICQRYPENYFPNPSRARFSQLLSSLTK